MWQQVPFKENQIKHSDGPRHPLLVMYKLPNLQTKPLGRIPKQIDQETLTLLNLHKGQTRITRNHQESPGITTNHQESPGITTNHHESPRITTNHHESQHTTKKVKIKRNEYEPCVHNEKKKHRKVRQG